MNIQCIADVATVLDSFIFKDVKSWMFCVVLCLLNPLLLWSFDGDTTSVESAKKSIFWQILDQEEAFLMVDGLAVDELGNKLSHAEVYLFENGRIVESAKANKRGRFKIILNKNRHFELVIFKPGYRVKNIGFNTSMPSYAPKYNKYLIYAELAERPADEIAFSIPKPEVTVIYDKRLYEFRRPLTFIGAH